MSLAFCMLSALPAIGQKSSAYPFPTVLGDTLVNTDSVAKAFSLTANYPAVSIIATLKKGTGTLNGKMYLYQSMDGANYNLSDSASYQAVPSWSYTTATGTHTARIDIKSPGAVRYIVLLTQSGSLTSTPVWVAYTARQ